MKHPIPNTNMLFSSVTLGPYTLKNRIVMPPLTRSRSTQPDNIPNELMASYYSQRASAGFMVTEGTQIEPRGQGYAWTPGIHSQAQIEGWKKVTQAVHAKGGVIFAQLWHVGRVSHTSLQPNEGQPIAPSADNVKVFVETGPGEGALADPSAPRALSTAEVGDLVDMYAQAARNALEAGFDGVELHCANGYLVNQFISEHSNTRDDQYGGSLTNRLRFLKEIVAAVSEVVGAERLGVRFAPLFASTDETRVYLGLVESDPHHTYVEAFYQAVRAAFSGRIIYAGKYTVEKSVDVLSKGYGDLFAFGRPFIANPDLPERIANNWPLNETDPDTMYGGTEIGYNDYPYYQND